MSPNKPQPPQENDPKAGLSPWVVGGALTAGAAAWFIVQIIQRLL